MRILLPLILWPRVYRAVLARVVLAIGCRPLFHQTGESLGEWLCGIVQWQTARRVVKRRTTFTLKEVQVIIEQWRRNITCRPHSALGYQSPVSDARTLTEGVD